MLIHYLKETNGKKFVVRCGNGVMIMWENVPFFLEIHYEAFRFEIS